MRFIKWHTATIFLLFLFLVCRAEKTDQSKITTTKPITTAPQWHEKGKQFLQQLEKNRKNVEHGLVQAIKGFLSKFDRRGKASCSSSSSAAAAASSVLHKVSDRPWWSQELDGDEDGAENSRAHNTENRPLLPLRSKTSTKSSKSLNDWSWITQRRMSRACRRRHHYHEHHCHDVTLPLSDDELVDPMLLASYPESAAAAAAVRSSHPVSLAYGARAQEPMEEYSMHRSTYLEEPVVGMELQVYHQEQQCVPFGNGNMNEANPHVIQQQQQQQQQQLQPLACDGDGDDNNDGMELPKGYSDSYILVEPMHLQLGVVPKHILDYAYKPVVSITTNEEENPTHLHEHRNNKASPRQPFTTLMPQQPQVEDIQEPLTSSNNDDNFPNNNDSNTAYANDTTVVGGMGPTYEASEWWRWWFPCSNSWWKDPSQEDGGYDRSGNSAFAGGSHGEVWKGRRKCHHRRMNRVIACDDRQTLILKRLKVEQGYRLLEAGLREVYFGNMLTNQLHDQGLFTVYVDHFFREIVRPSIAGRPMSKDLELWIVLEDAGPSLRSYLYSAVTTGDFIVYQQSALWYTLRMGARGRSGTTNEGKSVAIVTKEHRRNRRMPRVVVTSGRELMREVLRQILTSAAFLHEQGIVHRDIKPSNVMCRAEFDPENARAFDNLNLSTIHCVLGDFSSAWNNFTAQNLYTNGPSQKEQTDEYAPPEALFAPSWVPFHEHKPQSYDSWSIGVLALELMLGTPNVFSVDQRTTVLLSTKMRKAGASAEELQRALYLAALSQFCIYMPAVNASKNGNWPMRQGEPLHNVSMAKKSCTLHDFHRALRARDPLGVGFDSSADSLLRLIWELLAWNPMDRITAAEALTHPFFTDSPLDTSVDLVAGSHNALESQMLDPRMDFNLSDTVSEFVCPKCGRKFDNWRSCQTHATSRRHALFCEYDRSALPTCLNAHVMLPAHPKSGYCDIQGRRRVIEDFHAIHLHPSHQFYGVFDGHTGNLASKFAASSFYEHLSKRLSTVDEESHTNQSWRSNVLGNLTESFAQVHDSFLKALANAPHGMMDQSGTTATVVFVTNATVITASIGDSRAVLSSNGDSHRLGAIELTVDHVASNEAERRMVEARGGYVSVSGGLARVNGTLAITRSIGDADLAPLLSRTPYVMSLLKSEINELCGVSTSSLVPCFIVLATDGLWDVITNEEAVNMVSHVVVSYDAETNGLSWEGGAFQKAAEQLTQEAYMRGSTDNIGVCVIAID